MANDCRFVLLCFLKEHTVRKTEKTLSDLFESQCTCTCIENEIQDKTKISKVPWRENRMEPGTLEDKTKSWIYA